MDKMIEAIEETISLLYQEKEDEAYKKIAELIPFLTMEIDKIDDMQKQKEFVDVLGSALEAMENKDLTLLADVLQYDLLEHLG